MTEIFMKRVQAEETNVLHGKKAELRKVILKNRNALSPEQRQMWDNQILERLIEYERMYPCPVYLCYVSYKSEVATKDFILWCLREGKIVFVPKVVAESPFVTDGEKEIFTKEKCGDLVKIGAKSTEMKFYRITAWEELRAGYQGIPEPEALPERALSLWLKKTEKETETAKKPDKRCLRMLLPGAVFDRDGNRIGYGGGFYDRWLAKWNRSCSVDTAVLEKIGLAYDIQIVGAIPAESFDQKADYVITEKCGNRVRN